MNNCVSKYTDAEKIFIYSNFVNPKQFLDIELSKELIEKYKNKFVLSYIGGFDYHRGIFTLLKTINCTAQTKRVACITLMSIRSVMKNLIPEKIARAIKGKEYAPWTIKLGSISLL